MYELKESFTNLVTPSTVEKPIETSIEEISDPGKFYVIPKKTEDQKPLTLVLDLDETLVHFTELSPDKRAMLPHLTNQEKEFGGYYTVRPYALSFLSEMSEMFEIIVFTAGTKSYADWILN